MTSKSLLKKTRYNQKFIKLMNVPRFTLTIYWIRFQYKCNYCFVNRTDSDSVFKIYTPESKPSTFTSPK